MIEDLYTKAESTTSSSRSSRPSSSAHRETRPTCPQDRETVVGGADSTSSNDAPYCFSRAIPRYLRVRFLDPLAIVSVCF